MSSPFPTVQSISGVGKPRLILVLARPYARIKASYVGNPGTVEFYTKHGLTTGMSVRISGHSGSTPAINSDYVATVVDEYKITIPVNITVAGTGGAGEALTHIYESTGTTTFTATTAAETGSPTFSAVRAGHRIFSTRTSGGLDYPTYGKVLSKATGVLTIDGWSNGTPTGGNKFRADGYIADLPRTQEMTEIFTPDVLVHSLYNGDNGSIKKTKMRGWGYDVTLDYSAYTDPDMLYDLRAMLSQRANDELILIPRADAPGYQYPVYFSRPVSLSKYGRSAGYKKLVWSFSGKENLASWPLLDGFGMSYGTNYGTNY